MNDPVILVCPCCASTVDADPGDAEQQFECLACGQNWSMTVDAERCAEYALT